MAVTLSECIERLSAQVDPSKCTEFRSKIAVELGYVQKPKSCFVSFTFLGVFHFDFLISKRHLLNISSKYSERVF